jgi:hypothetical protein
MAVIGRRLFRVALRAQPVDPPGALHPVVKVGFAGQPFDVADLSAGNVGLNLPLAFRDALRLENDFHFWSFAHEAEYDGFGLTASLFPICRI